MKKNSTEKCTHVFKSIDDGFFKCKAIQICINQQFASLLVCFFYRTFVFFFSVPKWLGEVCFPNNPPILQSICWIVTKSVHGRIQNPITYK